MLSDAKVLARFDHVAFQGEEGAKKPRIFLHSVGFEPTSTNTFELESNPLDRSGMNADGHRLRRI